MHASLVPQTFPILGDPGRVSDAAGAYGETADLIRDLASQLRRQFDFEAIGKAADQFKTDAEWVADEIGVVAPRYEGTADALAGFVDDFADAQRRADIAIGDIAETQAQLWPLYDELYQAESDITVARATDEEDGGIAAEARAEAARNEIASRIAELEGALDDLVADYQRAVEDHDAAAHAAADAISPILGELNDGFWASVGAFFSAVGGWLLDAFEQVMQWVSDLCVFVLAVVSLVVALALFLNIVGLAVFLQDPNSFTYTVTGFAMAVLTPLHGLLVPALAFEIDSPTPKMVLEDVRVDATDMSTRYQQAFDDVGELDTLGGADHTKVEIVKVVDDFGNVSWRVIPPSTQDWEGAYDGGAANDLGSNLALMLTPEQQAAYERMVIEAMEQAGIGPDDPVMMVGFSQSGILAGRMAERSDFNIEAIVVAGAPIDAMRIPADVSVVSIQHQGDPVHHLDGAVPSAGGGEHVTLHVNPYGDPADGGGLEDYAMLDVARHDAALYGDTIQAIVDGTHPEVTSEQQRRLEAIIADQSRFFSDAETSYLFTGAE